MKNRKTKSLMKNVHKLSKIMGGPNVSYDMLGKNCQETQITRENMKVLDSKMLTPLYHLKPLKCMLQHEFFEESSKEGMISIISVLTKRQRIRKSTIRKTPWPAETPRSDQQSLISSFFVKNRPTERKTNFTNTKERREWCGDDIWMEICLIELFKHQNISMPPPPPLDFQKISMPPLFPPRPPLSYKWLVSNNWNFSS